MNGEKLRTVSVILGDVAVLYLSLALTVLSRYGWDKFGKWWILHFFPFSVLFIVWVVVFWVAGLYDPLSFSANQRARERVIKAVLFAGAIGITLFYVFPQIGIAPKTNLAIDLAVSASLLILWRKFYGLILSRSGKIRVLFFGFSPETEELINFLTANPHLGYEPVLSPKEGLSDLIRQKKADLAIAPTDTRENTDFIRVLYEVLPLGVAYLNFPEFYERITGKVPVSTISEIWFLENLAESQKRVYELAKRTFDIIAGALLGLITLAILPFVGLAIKTESRGPIFFRQKRAGKNGKPFLLIKFRSKIHDGGEKKSGWDKTDDEKRTTSVGKILRRTYIDELPQCLNILKGDMSLIGPRPERPEFVEELKTKIPHYMMRLLVRPGISGWAQIRMDYDASASDALEKLQHDLYYIKARSFWLDLSIAFKTLFTMISRPGR